MSIKVKCPHCGHEYAVELKENDYDMVMALSCLKGFDGCGNDFAIKPHLTTQITYYKLQPV